MHYSISQSEITRRKKAYLTFSFHIIVGIFIGTIVFQSFLTPVLYFVVITALLLIGIYSFRFFSKLTQTVIYLDNEYLIKKTPLLTERYLISTINRVEVKWTTQKTIREIYTWLTDGSSVFITALEKFTPFKAELFSYLSPDTVVTTKQERIAFDHPLFYILLGTLTGFLSYCGFQFLVTLDHSRIHILSFILCVYSLMLGLYFIITKPTAKRSGKNTIYFDYIAGTLLMGLGIFVLMYV